MKVALEGIAARAESVHRVHAMAGAGEHLAPKDVRTLAVVDRDVVGRRVLVVEVDRKGPLRRGRHGRGREPVVPGDDPGAVRGERGGGTGRPARSARPTGGDGDGQE